MPRQSGFFVTRLKSNACHIVTERRPVPMRGPILTNELIEFQVFQAGRKVTRTCRRVEVWLPEEKENLVLLTNHLDFGSTTTAAIYKERWQIEIFFKAIKQNLKIKTFVGTSANVVQIQIWTALISMLLLKYLQFCSRLPWSLSNLVALLRWNLFTYRGLWKWIDQPFETPPEGPPDSQLILIQDGTQPNPPNRTSKNALSQPPLRINSARFNAFRLSRTAVLRMVRMAAFNSSRTCFGQE